MVFKSKQTKDRKTKTEEQKRGKSERTDGKVIKEPIKQTKSGTKLLKISLHS